MCGVYAKDSGRMLLENENTGEFEEVEIKTPLMGQKAGLSMVFQELNLIPYLTVAENIFFGREIQKFGMRNIKKMEIMAQELCDEMGIEVDVNTRVRDLGIAYQQIVEIMKAVSKNAKFIIMDEPTAPLTLKETDIFFKIVRSLRKKGVTIIFISHRLEEVFELCDRVTVFCDGKYMVTKAVKDVTKKQLIAYMVGRELTEDYPGTQGKTGEICLEVSGITNGRVKEASFTLRRGEIVGIGGLVGAGRTELARILYGADRYVGGKMVLNGKPYMPKSPKDALRKGIGLIPEDRKQQGLVLGFSVEDNTAYSSLERLSKGIVVQNGKTARLAEEYIEGLRIKTPDKDQLVKRLSGGNQQKVVIARILATKCDILIFDEPTRGIDVGAKQEIYALMASLADQGKSIIMISSEMPELIGMSDRMLIMNNGKIVGELKKEEFTQERILEIASAKEPGQVI